MTNPLNRSMIMNQRKKYRTIAGLNAAVSFFLLFAGLLFCGGCSSEDGNASGGNEAEIPERRDLSPVEIAKLGLEGLSQMDIDVSLPYMYGSALTAMQENAGRFRTMKMAADEGDIKGFLVAFGTSPEDAAKMEDQILRSNQEVVFWDGIRKRFKEYDPSEIVFTEKIEGDTAVVTRTRDEDFDMVYFIRKDGLWYFVSPADYRAFLAEKAGSVGQTSAPETMPTEKEKTVSAEQEDPFAGLEKKAE